ncbi:MAG TPA: ATP-dependent DNA helicase RecQ [Candidatus Eisenbacteria bacterium]|nr:ATP-dependent DNA helicase RecQ [Candidatus Eisenbacteria bacterium]
MRTTTRSTSDFETALHDLGYDAFRPGQREALETLFRHRRLLLVAPTGGGKSLIYQLPATMLEGTTLVISPLIALMQDQVAALQQRGVAATYLASTLGDEEARARLRGIRAGEYRIVYVAPERLPYPGFQDLARELDPPLVAIDEAHCISHWGHDFRREYLAIGDFVAKFPRAMVLACTATATPAVRDDIVTQLKLGADTPQILRGFARPNLSLRVATPESASDLRLAIDDALAEALGGPGRTARAPGAAILYCLSRADAENEAKRLRAAGWRAGWYHAGLSGDLRSEVQNRFMAGDLDVVAATNAFGMGIDRADVRAVIHLSPPDSVEAYYQEVGRAGRDGKDAFGLLLLRLSDIPRRKSLIERGASQEEAGAAWVEHRWSMFRDLLRWAEGGSCRHDAILRYFGDEVETLHGCGRCDVCRELAEGGSEEDAAARAAESREVAMAILGAVRLVDQRLGLKVTVKFLRGETDDRLVRYGLGGHREAGSLARYPEAWLAQALQRCVTAGWVDFTEGEYPLLMLTALGKAVLAGKREARLILPPRTSAGGARRSRGDSRRGAGSGRGRAGGLPGAFRAADALGGDKPAGYATRFDALRRWRLERARFEGKPAFTIAPDRTLDDIATVAPASLEELGLCHGIGPAKLEKYGAEILAILKRTAR